MLPTIRVELMILPCRDTILEIFLRDGYGILTRSTTEPGGLLSLVAARCPIFEDVVRWCHVQVTENLTVQTR
jgi:hypothetical protein